MYQRLPMYQRLGAPAMRPGLENILKLCAYFNQPQHSFKSIHIAGTNGKGSVSHGLSAVLQTAGYQTGLYTSPHLKSFRERIRVNGKKISKKAVVEFIETHRTFFENSTYSFFEITFAMALWNFRQQHVQVAVIETGLGGRLDATNIIQPELSLITHIGFDHKAFLGDTIEKIAFEKAGIIKPKTPVLIGRKQQETKAVFEDKAKAVQAAIYYAEDLVFNEYETDLLGSYQKENIRSIVAAAQLLRQKFNITDAQIQNALLHITSLTGLMGRYQILSNQPKTILDVAHNPEGLNAVFKQILTESFQQLHIVFGMVSDKDLHEILTLLPKQASYYFCAAKVPRAMAVDQLFSAAKAYKLKGKAFKSVKKAFNAACKNASKDDLIFVGGSTFTVAEVL